MSRARTAMTGARWGGDDLGGLREGLQAALERGRGVVAKRGSPWKQRLAGLAAEVQRRPLLRQGLAAAERGNADAAFALLREATALRPEHTPTALAYWEVAVECERAEAAAEPMARLVQREASTGEKRAAIDHWMALMTQAPASVVDAGSLARMLPELKARLVAARDADERERARAWLVSALRQCLDPRAGGLTPGLALRVFEESRALEPEVARRAARVVLDSPDLHETKRSRVEALLAALDDPVPPAPDLPDPSFLPPLVVIEVAPVELSERALLLLETHSEQRTRVDFRAVEAISIAHVGTGQDAALVLDLVLQRSRRRAPRRVLRMREGSFDATAFDPNSADACQALGVLASELLERTHAIALPDDDGERSDPVPHFDDLEGYESEVLDGLRR